MRADRSLRTLVRYAIVSIAMSTEVSGSQDNFASSGVAWGSLRCAQDGPSTLPTPTYGNETVIFDVCSQVIINAPPAAVYNALLDFQSYSLWNSFVVDVTLPKDVQKTPDDLYIGTKMVFTTKGVLPYINTTSTETITEMNPTQDPGYLMASWRYDDGLGGTLQRAEHPTILVDQGDGSTLCVSYESYYSGLLAPVLRLSQGTLQKLFVQQNNDLKAYVEGKRK